MGWGRLQFWGYVVVCLWPGSAFAGAWNQAAGEGQVITTSGWSSADESFLDGDTVEIEDFSKTEFRVWFEHGLSRNLTIVANAAWLTLDYQDQVGRIDFDGLDDTELGLQYEVARREGLAASIRASYIIDTKLDKAATSVLSAGDEVELRVLLGQSRELPSGVVFHDTQFALRSSGDALVTAMQGAVTLGYKPSRRTLLMAQGFANYGYELGGGDRTTVPTGPFSEITFRGLPEQSQLMGQLSVARQYKPGRYVQLGYRQTLWGRNIVKERGVFLGLWTEY